MEPIAVETDGRFWQGVAAGLPDGHGPPVERAATVRALPLEHLERARPAGG